eukprot:TRINITY_DN6474_c1_g1_i1.p1 TRINITY_DN6474_c1_g1~~TRINITY_DN6474_c1_g1_i1.p1  ORF type:complete len:130 (+),score=36.55 TRINITY_DN6474_c1_g1_i1:47-391(+)
MLDGTSTKSLCKPDMTPKVIVKNLFILIIDKQEVRELLQIIEKTLPDAFAKVESLLKDHSSKIEMMKKNPEAYQIIRELPIIFHTQPEQFQVWASEYVKIIDSEKGERKEKEKR